MNKLRNFAKHYLFGLVVSCWKAGVHAVKINGGLALAAQAEPAAVPHVDLQLMLMVFAVTAVWQAVDYFDTHPLPASLDQLEDPPAPAAPVPVPALPSPSSS